MIYPPQLLSPLKARLAKIKGKPFSPPPLPKDDIVNELLETSYHASFLTEEGRKLHFRLIYASEEDLKSSTSGHFPNAHKPIVLDTPRPFAISEILRLAPALDMTQVLICVKQINRSNKNPKLGIWGLLDTGSSWWNFTNHESSHGRPPPNHLTISCTEPGQLSVSAQGRIFITLRNGVISEPSWGALYDGPVGDFFEEARIAFQNDVIKELGAEKYDEDGHDEEYPQRAYTFFIERLLFHIREKSHGGTIFFVPDYITHNDTRLLDRLNIKYPINHHNAWNLIKREVATHRKYYDLYFPMSSGSELTKQNFNELTSLEDQKERLDETISDSVRFIAGLSGVDGAVVITDRLRVLGFGAEVIAQSPNLTDVLLPGRRKKKIEDYGTRHRSAFRFCSSFEESVAFIVSSDGGVKATIRTGSEVNLWPDINVGIFGI